MAAPGFFTQKTKVPVGQRRYAEGLGYYSAGNPAALAKAKAKRVAARQSAVATNPLASVVSMLQQGVQTQPQIEASARKSVNAQIAAEQLALNRTSQEAREEAYRQAQAAEGFNQAVMNFAGRHASAIEGIYGTQAGALSSLGSTLGGSMQGTENAALAASQADVDRLAPGGQVPAYIPSGEGAAAVQGVTGAAASALGQRGGGYSDEAYGRALAAGLSGRDLADRYRYEAIKLNRDRLGKIAELQATRPKLYEDALSAARTQRNQQLATLISALSLQTGNVEDAAQLGLAQNKFQFQQTEALRDAMKDQGMDVSGNPLPGNYRDPRTGRIMELPSGTVIGPKGLPVKLVTPKAGGKAGKQPSLTDWAKTRQRMMTEGATRLGIAEDSTGKIELWWSLKNIKDYVRRYASDFKSTFGEYPQLEQMVNEVSNTLFNQLKQRRRAAAGAGQTQRPEGAKSF